MQGVSALALLHLPVRSRGIVLGRPVDIVLDLGSRRAVGLDVRCGDAAHRFLPLPAAELLDDEVRVDSALTLLDSFSGGRRTTFRSLLGATVERDGVKADALSDVVLDRDGSIRAIVAGPRRIDFDEHVTLVPTRRSASAA
jgi:hypothetical protein